MDDERPVEMVLPDGPLPFEAKGWRALLDVLTTSAERELGPDWRDVLRERTR